MNPVPKSLSWKFCAWLFKTQSTTVTVIALRSMTYFQNIVSSRKPKNSQNIQTGQKSEKSSRTSRRVTSKKSHHEYRDGSKFCKSHLKHRHWSKIGKSHHKHREGSKFKKKKKKKKNITNIETGHDPEQWLRTSRWANRAQTEDRDQDMKEFVQNESEGSKMEQGKLKDLVMSMLLNQKLEQENMK